MSKLNHSEFAKLEKANMAAFNGRVFASVADIPSEFIDIYWSKRWPNFTPDELKCKGTGAIMVDVDALDKLQALRNLLGVPLHLTSAFRSKKHNNNLRKRGYKTAKKSKHLEAKAYDIQTRYIDPVKLERAARKVEFTGFGFYIESGFMHIDTGKAREWGQRWPEGFNNPEFQRARDLRRSRRAQGRI